MCGRFSLGVSPATLLSHFNVQESVVWGERYNLTPGQEVLTIVQPAEGQRELRGMRWGLIPAWAKDLAIGDQLINARAETVASKPAFRAAFRERRCLIVTDGFYEWKKAGRQKQPYIVRMRGECPFALAGLWEGPQGTPIDSCRILMATPNDLRRPLHHRMAVILLASAYDLSLGPRVQEAGRLHALLCPYPAEEMTAYPVSAWVNSSARDSTTLMEPVPTSPQ